MPTQICQLAAIMFIDIVGYTKLIGEDEQKALQMLRKNRNLHKFIIKKHYGKWLKEMDDVLLRGFCLQSMKCIALRKSIKHILKSISPFAPFQSDRHSQVMLKILDFPSS